MPADRLPAPSLDARFLLDLLAIEEEAAAVLDRDLRYVAVSGAYARLSGRTAEAHAGQSLDAFTPALAFPLARFLRPLFEGGAAAAQRRLLADAPDRPGGVQAWEARAVPVRDGSGAVVAAHVTLRAPNEPSRAEAGGERVAERLLALVTEIGRTRTVRGIVALTLNNALPLTGATAGGLSLLEPDGEALRVLGASGYDDTVLRAWPLVPLAVPIPATVAVNEARSLFLTFEDVARDFPEAAEAPAYAGQAHVALPLLFDGRPLGALTLNFPDRAPFGVTERNAMTALAETCAQALHDLRQFDAEREAREHLERTVALIGGVFEHAPVGFAVFDPKLRFVRLNAAFAALSGHGPGAHVGEPVTRLLPDLPELAHVLALVRQTRQAVTRHGLAWRPPSGGAARTLRADCSPVLNSQGSLVGVGCTVIDVAALSET